MLPLRTAITQGLIALVLVTASLMMATQWAAAMLGSQPALGAAWCELFGFKLYAPWKLIVWWLVFDSQAPDVFARAGAVAALGGIAGGAVAVGGAARRASRKNRITTYGSARWADGNDVRNAGLLNEKGIVLGLWNGWYLRHDGPEHVIAVAPTRSGKGVGLVVPTLLTWPHSAVVHDIKGENWSLTAGWRSRFSHCLLFDPTNPLSARFNPLLEVRKGAMEVRDVQNIADILVDPEGAREQRDHWEKTAHALLVGTILHVLYAEQEKTLARVATFLSDPTRSIGRTLSIMLTTNHLGTDTTPVVHPVVASVARELMNKADNERSGVVSTAMSLLGLYRDPIIAATTATARAPDPEPDRASADRDVARRDCEPAPAAAHARRVPRARPARFLRVLLSLPCRLWCPRLPRGSVTAPDRQGLRPQSRHSRQLPRPCRLCAE
jgi:type IV secretion system protein VirD4